MNSSTVIKNLRHLFSIFGIPAFIHTERETSFISQEIQTFLTSHAIASSRTTPYKEMVKLNEAIALSEKPIAAKSKGLDISQWEQVIEDALHSIRSLYSVLLLM